MTGKTHVAVGMAASSLLLKYSTNKIEFSIIAFFTVIGALMPDVDQKQSIIGHTINVIVISILSILIAIKFIGFLPQYSINLHSQYLLENIIKLLTEDILPISSLLALVGCILMIINIVIARKTGHRQFSHSIAGFFSFSLGIYLLFGKTLLPAFEIGFISHLLIDILNHKDVNVFYPFRFGISLKIAHAGGIIDHFIGIIAIIVFLVINLS